MPESTFPPVRPPVMVGSLGSHTKLHYLPFRIRRLGKKGDNMLFVLNSSTHLAFGSPNDVNAFGLIEMLSAFLRLKSPLEVLFTLRELQPKHSGPGRDHLLRYFEILFRPFPSAFSAFFRR